MNKLRKQFEKEALIKQNEKHSKYYGNMNMLWEWNEAILKINENHHGYTENKIVGNIKYVEWLESKLL